MWTSHRALGFVGLSCATCLGSCSDHAGPSSTRGTDELARVSQEVLGGTGTVGCSREHRTVLRHALLLGRARVLSDEYAACLEDRIMNRPYVACVESLGQTPRFPVDPPLAADPGTAALATLVSRKENGTLITCGDLQRDSDVSASTRGLTLWSDIHTLSHDRLESLSLDTNGFLDRAADLDDADLASVANTIWHEVFHTHGFWHDAPGTDCIDQTIVQAMPFIAGECVESGARPCADQSSCTDGGTIGLSSGAECKCLTVFGAEDVPCIQSGSFPDCDGPVTFVGPATPIRESNEEGDAFGAALSAGDFDGDGFDDLAVGVPGENDASGAVDVYFGTRFGLIPLLRLHGTPQSEFGSALSAGDFDFDGQTDLAVGSPGFQNGLGSVTVIYGSKGEFGQSAGLHYLPQDRVNLFGTTEGDRFGASLSASSTTVFGLLAVGAPGRERGTGTVALFASNAAADPRAFSLLREFVPADVPEGSGFGFSLDAKEERAGASFTHLLVGAPYADGGLGRAYLLDGERLIFESWRSRPFESLAPSAFALELKAKERRAGAHFGKSVALGSFDGEQQKAIVGAPGSDSVYVFDAEANGQRGKLENLLEAEGGFGTALATLPRPPGRGIPPLASLFVGAPRAGGGFVELLSSGFRAPSFSRRVDQFALSERSADDSFGAALALGDFDADGHVELAIGAPGERARGSCAPPSGAFFVFRKDQFGACDRPLPVKVYSQEGGLSEFERPLTLWSSIAHYQEGDRVLHDCDLFVARSTHDSSAETMPHEQSAFWTRVTPVQMRRTWMLEPLAR